MKRLDELGISPAPWRNNRGIIVSDNGRFLSDGDGIFILNANASLIAAAPDLYDALHTAMLYADKLSDEWPLQKHVKDKMRAALAKASGEVA